MSSVTEKVILDQSQYRLIGAVVWLVLLVIVVPIWYSNPVNFQPKNLASYSNVTEEVVDKSSTPPQQSLVDPKQNLEQVSTPIEKDDKIPASKKISSTWIIRLASYENKDTAEALMNHLKYDYEVSIKFFPNSAQYSVRAGPYDSEEQAQKDQEELNNLLRIQSELVKIPNPQALEN